MKKINNLICDIILLDYEDFSEEAARDFKRTLEKFGVNMYDAIGTKGSDNYGFVLTDKKITKKEQREIEVNFGLLEE